MAQPLQNITIAAPAFKGLNTQDSPLSGDVQYASVVDNAIIDTFGRIGARKGLQALTENPELLNGATPTVIHEYEDASGNLKLLTIADNKIFEGTSTLVDITPSGYTVSDENYSIVNFNDKAYLFNKNHQPLIYDTTNGLVEMVASSGTAPQGDIAIGGFGRLWVSGIPSTPNTIYWSDLLIGDAWNSGSSGSIDLDKVWPDGSDKVTALAIWNGFLIIFGYNSIVIYQGAEDPATMSLADTINGVGCVARDTVQATGTDLLFLSSRGVMSLGRVIQEKSNPINDVSKNVRDDLINFWRQETQPVRSVYSPVDSFYLLLFPTNNLIYCFDTRGLLDNGGFRVTTWTTANHRCFHTRQDDTLLIGNSLGVNRYINYTDNNESYTLRYYSNPLSFGNPAQVKMLKKITPTLITSGNTQVNVKWSYDVTNDYKTQTYQVSSVGASYFGEALFYSTEAITNDSGLFTSGSDKVSIKRINTSGSGNLVNVGLESVIQGASMSIQEFNIQATIGRIY
jgi:hypothetical protein